MKVKELSLLLDALNPDAEVIIFRDPDNYGYGTIKYIRSGIFAETNFGNDFYVDQTLIMNPKEIKALCFYPEDYVVHIPSSNDKINQA